MAKNTTTKVNTTSDKIMKLIIAVVILAVFALAVYATYGKISANMEQKAIEAENSAIENGTQEANVRYLASTAGMSEEEYLEQYGLALGEDITSETVLTDMTNAMTIENYYKYNDDSQSAEEPTDVDALLTQWGAEEYGITKDTTWKEMNEKLPFGKYIGEENFDGFIEQYSANGYDLSEISADMTISEVSDKLSAIMQAGPTGTVAPQEDAETPEE